ncbi:MAG: amidohydrolase, partial [Pseudomonadota bacterium]
MRRITCLIVSLGLSASAIADTLYTNMKGYTLTSPAGENAVLQEFSTMLVENGRIQAIGGETLAQRFADIDSTVDMNGKTVLPGLTDA